MVLWQHVILCKSMLLRIRLTVGVDMHTHSQAYSQQHTLTQYDILPQHHVNIKKFIGECF